MQLKTLHRILSSPLSIYHNNPEKITKDPDYGYENMLTPPGDLTDSS